MSVCKLETAKLLDISAEYHAKHKLGELDFSTHSPAALRGYQFGDTDGANPPSGKWNIAELRKYSTSVIHKWTRTGSPVVYFPMGYSDARGVYDHVTGDELESTIVVSFSIKK